MKIQKQLMEVSPEARKVIVVRRVYVQKLVPVEAYTIAVEKEVCQFDYTTE